MAASNFMGSSARLRVGLLPSVTPRLSRRALATRASADSGGSGPVRVRFAPSPTGNLHVGGARTALFNYLFARSRGGKFVLRVEDTDLERSTKKSEEAVLTDLSWLGLDWDEGPDIGGDFGPYRQSERNALYKEHAQKLMESGAVYRCFCSNEELEKMKETANRMKIPPVYMGKWATASDAEVQQELEKGTPYTYRFRVPKEGSLKINDLIRGEVSWNLNTLGDFVIMRSNGQPVYNFCVTVDDATMRISHVIRAEEHLPNTLRQALIYKALGFAMPLFAHVSLILAPDKSKLSKRHGATSVGQYKEMGYLPQAMVNYLALLGWGDGTENEFFTIDDLVEKFTIDRVNKSGAVFDATKLKHLRSLPSDLLIKDFEDQWRSTGILLESESGFAKEAAELLKEGIDLITDADAALCKLLSYPLHETLSSDEAKSVVEDKLSEVASGLISAYDSGELDQALAEGHDGWKKWVKSFGKTHKGREVAIYATPSTVDWEASRTCHGQYRNPRAQSRHLWCGSPSVWFVSLDERFKILKEVDWESLQKQQESPVESAVPAAS
ncbi:Glutamate--tRNA ligase, chloroplastic/mitochondrial [Hordeum vulgare]|nr:Glutamate--tRNA ligase, chloroplastic/mitochondrial [Hordeum vulgare]